MRRATAVFAIIASFLLASCGGSDEPDAATATDSSASADADKGKDTEASDPCTTLSAAAVGEILGGPVTLKEAPGGGCGFDQDDPRAASVGIFAVVGAGGGFEASKAGNVVDGDVEDLPGVGDGAWLAVGTSGGDNLQGQGVAALGDQLVNITLIQGNGLDEPTVRKMVVDLLTLVGSDA